MYSRRIIIRSKSNDIDGYLLSTILFVSGEPVSKYIAATLWNDDKLQSNCRKIVQFAYKPMTVEQIVYRATSSVSTAVIHEWQFMRCVNNISSNRVGHFKFVCGINSPLGNIGFNVHRSFVSVSLRWILCQSYLIKCLDGLPHCECNRDQEMNWRYVDQYK